jgi:3-hydroxybutyryl-CoA dehydrogenase
MAIANLTVLGTGVLGMQIAFHAAYKGLPVICYDVGPDPIRRARTTVDDLALRYLKEVAGADQAAVDAARARLTFTTDLKTAAAKADLVIEAIPERLDLKRKVFAELGRLAPAKTIFATNSSTLLPRTIADATGRPDRFLALHFANRIWAYNIAEVMGHAGTSPAAFKEVVAFACAIGMEPIEIRKEKSGYVLNSLLMPMLGAAAELYVDGIADIEAIDRTWRIATGAPAGPFEVYDAIGLTTAYNIACFGSPKQQAFARILKQNFIDKGHLGLSTGKGFYEYAK